MPAACISNSTPLSTNWSNSSMVREFRCINALTPRSYSPLLAAERNRQSHLIHSVSKPGRMTTAPLGSSACRIPVRIIPGAASGVDSDGTTQPALTPEAPRPNSPPSNTSTSMSCRCRCHAQHSPMTPPPTMKTFIWSCILL